MKKTLLRITLATTLCAAAPAFAEVVVQQPPPPAPTSDFVEAVTLAAKELKSLSGMYQGNPLPRLEMMSVAPFTPVTQQKLDKVLGVGTFSIKPVKVAHGSVGYTINLQPHNYLDSLGDTWSWTEMSVSLLLDSAGRNMVSSGQWPSINKSGKDGSLAVTGMKMESKQRRSANEAWLGTAHFKIGALTYKSPKLPVALQLNQLSIDAEAVARGKAVDMLYDMRIANIKAVGEQVDGLRMKMRMGNVDMRALEKFEKSLNGASDVAGTPQQQLAAISAPFITFAKSMAKHKTVIEFQEISASFHNIKALIKGTILLAPGKDADFESMATIVKKVVARFEVRVPVALIKEIAQTVALKQAQGKGDANVNTAQVSQMSESMADVMVGKALGSGFAKLENGVLVSAIEFKNGKLTVNGKAMALPKARPAPAPAPAPAPMPAPAAAAGDMPARAISNTCTTPAMPAELAGQQLTLSVELKYSVDANGRVTESKMINSSKNREFDKAAMLAVSHCKFIPALIDGKPAPAAQHHVYSVGPDVTTLLPILAAPSK